MVMLSSGEIEVAGVREEHPTIFFPTRYCRNLPRENASDKYCVSNSLPPRGRAVPALPRVHLSPSKVTP